MKKLLLLATIYASTLGQAWATAPWTVYSKATKSNPAIWQLRNKADLQRLIPKYINDPRACFYIMNEAEKRGLEVPAALIFQALQKQTPHDPKLQIIYAYATYIGAGPGSRAWFHPGEQSSDLVNEYGITSFEVRDALKHNESSPELLLMVATIQARETERMKENATSTWPEVFEVFRQCIALDPKWADARFEYGEALLRYALKKKREKAEYLPDLQKAETSLLLAQKLDPGMKGSCARLLAVVAREQKNWSKQLTYIDTLLKIYPSYKKDPYWGTVREKVVQKVAVTQGQ